MATYETLRQAINSLIKTNGNEEITGAILNQVLNAMITALGANYQFCGEATPSTNPGQPMQNVFYFAYDAGTYVNFGNITLPMGISTLSWDGTQWTGETIYQIDSTPVLNSTRLITSGGVYNALAAITQGTHSGFLYAGIAEPTDSPSALVNGQRIFYIATQAGTYNNFLVNYDIPMVIPNNGIWVLTSGADDDDWTAQEIVGIDDKPTSGSNNLVKSGGVFNELALGAVYDVSAKNPTAGPNNDGKFASLSALLSDANLNTLIPVASRKGGMSIKFVQSSDNKYVQYRLAASGWSTDIHDWTSEDPYFIDKVMQEVNEAIDEHTPIEITGDVTNAPDEEDLTSVNVGGTDVLKFKDKVYNSLTYSGMGRKILRKNIVGGVNILTNNMMQATNTIYVIQYDYDLNDPNGKNPITIPANCVLEFDGGSLSNGTITLENGFIDSNSKCFLNVVLSGTTTNDYIDAAWFGAIGDYFDIEHYTNNDNAFEYLVKSCESTKCQLFIRKGSGQYYFTNPLIFNGDYEVNIQGTLIYNGIAESTAVTIGRNDSHNTAKFFKVSITQYLQPSATIDLENMVADAPNNIGVKVINVYNADLYLDLIEKFIYGLITLGNGMACAYNKFYINMIRGSYVCATLASSNGGWNNENLFIGGRYVRGSSNQFLQVGRGIRFTSDTDYYNNSNTFLKPCLEGNYIAVEMFYGRNNTFIEPRTEGVTYSMITGNNSNNNVMIPTYGNRTVKEEGYQFGGVGYRFADLLSNNWVCIFDSGKLKYAGNTNTGDYGFSKFLQGDDSLVKYGKGATIDNDGYIAYSYGTPSVCVPIVFKTDEDKQISVSFNGGGRLRIYAYDSSGNLIYGDRTKVRVENNILVISDVFYQLGSTSAFGYHTYKVSLSSDVRKIIIVVRASRNVATDPYTFKMGRMFIYSNVDAYAPTQYDDNVYLNNIPDVSSSDITRVEAVTSNKNLTHWEKTDGVWVPGSLNKIAGFDKIKTVFDKKSTINKVASELLTISAEDNDSVTTTQYASNTKMLIGYILDVSTYKDVKMVCKGGDVRYFAIIPLNNNYERQTITNVSDVVASYNKELTKESDRNIITCTVSSSRNMMFLKFTNSINKVFVGVYGKGSGYYFNNPNNVPDYLELYSFNDITIVKNRNIVCNFIPSALKNIQPGDSVLSGDKLISWTGTRWVGSGEVFAWGVINNLSNLTLSGFICAEAGQTYNAKLTAVTGYSLPSTITVKMGSTTLIVETDYTYDTSNGTISILGIGGTGGVTADITITASGVANP